MVREKMAELYHGCAKGFPEKILGGHGGFTRKYVAVVWVCADPPALRVL